MKKYYKYIAIFTAVLLFNCEADNNTDLASFVGFEIGPLSLKVDKDGTSSRNITIHASEVAATDRNYSLEVGAASTLKAKYVVPATVTIPANSTVGTFTVSVTDDETLEFLNQNLVIAIKGEAGLNIGNPVVLGVTELCPDTLVTIRLTFDSWPEESTMELFDLSGADPVLMYAGGPYNGQTAAALNFCLTPGTYGVAVYDAYGDGGVTYSVASETTTYVGSITSKTYTSTAEFTIQ